MVSERDTQTLGNAIDGGGSSECGQKRRHSKNRYHDDEVLEKNGVELVKEGGGVRGMNRTGLG